MTAGLLSEEALPAATISVRNNVTIARRFNMSYGSGRTPEAAGKVPGGSSDPKVQGIIEFARSHEK